MGYLEVPGADLYYETVGEGRMLLCISGADGSCEIWRAFAECLKEKFKVVMWDRRGFSRSHLTGAQDYLHRLETDADDAARLIEHISPKERATVIGNSTGAIVALQLLIRHPGAIRLLLPYEPPAASLLSDVEELRTQHQEVYDIYRQSGVHPAFEKFANVTKADQATVVQSSDPKLGPFQFSNTQYWFEREFIFYPFAPFNVEDDFGPLKDKLMPVNGELSNQEPYQYRANAALADRLGLKLVHLPGEHVGHATHPELFSKALLEALKTRDSNYAGL